MNNKKYSKIIVFALSLALLIGAAVGIVANAENAENAPEILAKNIEYGDTLKFMVAINPSSVGGADKTVTFSVYEGDPENGKMLGKSVTAVYQDTKGTNLGVDYAYIGTATYGISPLAYGENYYLVAECEGVKTVTQYSVIEYFLERLYGDDIINATEEDELLQKDIYENAIAYGSSVQKYAAYEGKFSGTNVADYYYAYVEDGTINGGDNSEVFDPANASVTLAYTGTDSNVVGWIQTTYENGAVTTKDVALNATAALTGHTVFTPKYLEPLTEGETFDKLTTLKGDGKDSKVEFGNSTLASLGAPTSGDTIELAADPTGAANKVLKFVDAITSGASSIGVTESNNYASSEAQYATTVFETKIYIAPGESTSTTVPFAEFYFTAGRTQKSTNIRLYTQSNNTYAVFNVSGASIDATGAETTNKITTNAWHIIRLELDQHLAASGKTSVVRIYIDGLYAGSYNSTIDIGTSNINRLMWNSFGSNTSTVYFDNMSLTEKVTAYPAE